MSPRLGIVIAFAALGFAQPPLPSKRMHDGKQWTTHNLDIKTAPSYCYDDSETNCTKYGRLYTWQSARQACEAAGPGWRLPADDDWRKLAKAYGGFGEDSSDGGKAAYAALLNGGRSGFEAVLSGGRGEDGKYGRLDAHGFYWTSTQSSAGKAVFYNFGRGSLALFRQPDGEEGRAFAVRCVKD